jgi:hypothetical protein
MNWIKSIFSRKVPEPGAQKKNPELEKAYEMGRKMSEDMCRALDSFISQRFLGLKERYIGVFQDGLNSAKSSTIYSPIITGRVDFQLFCENIEKLKSTMTNEINEYMVEWSELSVVMEMESHMNELIERTVKNITEDIFFAGVSVFLDNADELKDADDAWRQANPELAAEQPLDDKKD